MDQVRQLVELRAPALAYLTLTHHNPTGIVATDGVRRALVELSSETGLPIVDDLELSAHVIDAQPPPPLAAYAPDDTIISIASMSKLFWAGLRVGWIRAAPAVLARLAESSSSLTSAARCPLSSLLPDCFEAA